MKMGWKRGLYAGEATLLLMLIAFILAILVALI